MESTATAIISPPLPIDKIAIEDRNGLQAGILAIHRLQAIQRVNGVIPGLASAHDPTGPVILHHAETGQRPSYLKHLCQL